MAKKLGLVKCRFCDVQIDREKQDDWIMPSRNFFYHTNCYETWCKKKTDITAEATNKEWQDMLWDYLKRDIRMPVDYLKMNRQWETFLKKGMTAKGMYFCIRYFYEIKKGDPSKSENGIGIIPYIYEECKKYWQKREYQQHGIIAKLEEQIRQTHKQKKVIINQKETKIERKKNYTLEELEKMLGDE